MTFVNRGLRSISGLAVSYIECIYDCFCNGIIVCYLLIRQNINSYRRAHCSACTVYACDSSGVLTYFGKAVKNDRACLNACLAEAYRTCNADVVAVSEISSVPEQSSLIAQTDIIAALGYLQGRFGGQNTLCCKACYR